MTRWQPYAQLIRLPNLPTAWADIVGWNIPPGVVRRLNHLP